MCITCCRFSAGVDFSNLKPLNLPNVAAMVAGVKFSASCRVRKLKGQRESIFSHWLWVVRSRWQMFTRSFEESC